MENGNASGEEANQNPSGEDLNRISAEEFFCPPRGDHNNVAIPLRRVGRQIYAEPPQLASQCEQAAEAAQKAIEPGAPFDLRSKLFKMLQYAIAREEEHPKRPEMLRRLRKAEAAARLLARDLFDLRMSALLCGDDVPFADIIVHLETMAARAEAARAQGNHKIYPLEADGPSPHELCALVVCLLWRQAKGEWPYKRDRLARQLCEDFWQSARGKHRVSKNWSGNNAGAGWEDHLKAARGHLEANTPQCDTCAAF